MKSRFLIVAAALALTLTSAQAETRLVVNCFWPSSHFACSEVLPTWIEEVERVTDRRVRGTILPKSVAPPPKQLESVEKGLADVAVQFNGLIQNRVKGPLVAMLPFTGIKDAEIMSKALWETNRRFFPDEMDTVHLLSQFVISPGELYSQTDKPINSVDELASRKLWALPGPLAAIAKELGSGVVSTPAVKSNEIISRGVVDGHFGLDPQAVKAFQLMPYTKSTTQFENAVYTTSFSVFVNKDKWAAISPEDQEAIMRVSGSVLGTAFGARWNKAAADAEASYATAGIEVVKADPTFEIALIEASKFVTANWMEAANSAGIDATLALEFYRQQLSK